MDDGFSRAEERLGRADGWSTRLDAIERTTADIKEILRDIKPKIDDLSSFAKYRAPELADKTDLLKMQAELKAGINARATRRQTIFDIFWVIGLITPAVMLGSRFGH